MEVTNSLIGEDDVLEKVLTSDIEKIRQTAVEIDHASFNAAVQNIVNAKNITSLACVLPQRWRVFLTIACV
jgi:DNA-binding MurR/RpiR family transcriptional regulator